MPDMTPAELDFFKALADATPPPPWGNGNPARGTETNVVTGPDGLEITVKKPGAFFREWKDIAAFVAAAREGVPALVAEVERLQAEVAFWKLTPEERYAFNLRAVERMKAEEKAQAQALEGTP